MKTKQYLNFSISNNTNAKNEPIKVRAAGYLTSRYFVYSFLLLLVSIIVSSCTKEEVSPLTPEEVTGQANYMLPNVEIWGNAPDGGTYYIGDPLGGGGYSSGGAYGSGSLNSAGGGGGGSGPGPGSDNFVPVNGNYGKTLRAK